MINKSFSLHASFVMQKAAGFLLPAAFFVFFFDFPPVLNSVFDKVAPDIYEVLL